jgi:hypothetical protein
MQLSVLETIGKTGIGIPHPKKKIDSSGKAKAW